MLQRRPEAADPESLERGVRQLLADKVSGTLVGLWLLVPEHLRLGAWDLLRTWSGQAAPQVQPRLALQLVHEAALCVSGIRQGRGLRQRHGFHLVVPMPNRASLRKTLAAWPPERFVRRWPGFATAKVPAQRRPELGPLYQLVQRGGEIPGQYDYKSFLATVDRDEVLALTDDFPARWHVEEFFDMHQALGWKRAGTLNLNVRYGQMSLALVAQAALHQLRQRLGSPYAQWEAEPLAKRLLNGLDGDLRVQGDTIVVTFYNAPDCLRPHYEGLPAKLQAEGVDSHVRWLYNFQLDFRFK